ncbi:M23 family metallopeptidase [Parafrankia sp. BMG5.11]|nr:M23 family metallopeptidase [Parafrankia sp. BMG5.11]
MLKSRWADALSALLLSVAAAPALADEASTMPKSSSGLVPIFDPAKESDRDGGARISVSRAADHVGTAVYFVRSEAAGSGSTLVVSSRKLPADAVFSRALPQPRFTSSRGASGIASSMSQQRPLAGMTVTSSFGWRRHPLSGAMMPHSGMDLAAPSGTPVFATSDGIVDASGWSGGYGLLVAVSHTGGLQTRYAHLSRLNVAQGQQVRRGEVIGYVGSTGNSTGPHLHYEIRRDGRAIDPSAHFGLQ